MQLLTNRLITSQTQNVERRRRHCVELTAKLDAMSPLKVLTRGYAMAQTADGNVLRSVNQVQTGDTITVSLTDGAIHAVVTDEKENA